MRYAIKRGAIVGIGVLLQIILTLSIYLLLGEYLGFINFIYSIIRIIIILGLIKYSNNYSYTLPWIIILLLFPIVGTLMFLILGNNIKKSKLFKELIKSEDNSKKYRMQDESIRKEIKDNSRLRYITDYALYPASKNNDVTYYPVGEEAYKDMLKELKKAEKFIFLEYFIIANGSMWNGILDILKEKVSKGVDVRVIYDDMGCISTLKKGYPKYLNSLGIKCIAFNKLDPIRGLIMNHRDHRKILVIDGKVGFSGGINISDEYINIDPPFGHWKDNGIRIKGDAVWNMTVMFLTLWNTYYKDDKSFTKYRYDFKDKKENDGYVIPYGDTPLDNACTGKDIYLNIINQAKHYLYIMTPYLIIDTDIINALVLAARRGVDVRVVIPGIPDKKIVYTLSESYAELLVRGGVKIYKYTPGFVHAKVFVADDEVATVGTINLDFRSLYLHYECGVYMEKHQVIKDIKNDLDDTISKSHNVTVKEATPGLIKNVWQSILRLFAPLM